MKRNTIRRWVPKSFWAISVLLFLDVSTLTASAQERSIVDVVNDWGLPGSWSVDCFVEAGDELHLPKIRPGSKNIRISWTSTKANGGSVRRSAQLPEGVEVSDAVRAKLLPNGMLEIESANRTRNVTYLQVLEKSQNGRSYHVYDSKLIQPEVKELVRAGKRIGEKNNTAWFNRCPEMS
jgi:hypothetical protein